MNSRRLIRRIASGDVTALEQLAEQYAGYVAAVIRRTLKAAAANEDVEELTADVFISLWNNAAKLRPESKIKAWLAVVARNRALRWARGKHFEIELTDGAAEGSPHSVRPAASDEKSTASKPTYSKLSAVGGWPLSLLPL